MFLMLPNDPIVRFLQIFQAAKGPISFLLGAVVVVAELVNFLFGHPVDTSLLFVGAGFIGLPILGPSSSKG